MIKSIYTYLCHPEKILDEYPNLVHYLPNDIRKKIGVKVSDKEDSRSSNHKSSSEDDYEKSSDDDDEKSSDDDEKYSDEDEKSDSD